MTPELQAYLKERLTVYLSDVADRLMNDLQKYVVENNDVPELPWVDSRNISSFLAVASSVQRIPLEKKHEFIMQALDKSGFSTVWVPKLCCLFTHTKALAQLIDNVDIRNTLDLQGYFTTSASVRRVDWPNCACFPLVGGAWLVVRCYPSARETKLWSKNAMGFPACVFNQHPDYHVIARAGLGVEVSDGVYMFNRANEVGYVIAAMGGEIEIPGLLADEPATIANTNSGSFVVSVKTANKGAIAGWSRNASKYTKVVSI
jgi:hypothetical protein